MKFMSSRMRLIILSFFMVFTYISAYAEGLLFSAPPRETAEQGQKIYGPIAAHLTKALGIKVSYEHPGNWLKYQREMRADKYDIVFDGPHFVSWRIANLGHEALVKLPGILQFVMVNDKNNKTFDDADKLIGHKICGLSPPHLSTLSVLNHYKNPVRQPSIKGIKGGMGKVYKTFIDKTQKCNAAILRTAYIKKKLKKEQKENFRTLFTSKAMPNQGLSVSKRVSSSLKEKITNELTVGQGVASTKGILKRFAGKAKSLVPVKPKEFDGYNNLLEGVIFGW